MFSVLPAPEPDDPGIYLNQSPLPLELWRSVEIALIAAVPGGPMVFEGPKGDAAAWQDWLDGEFTQAVAPHLVRAHAASHHGVRELAETDHAFDAILTDPQVKERSTQAGRRLLERHEGARHLKPISKLRTLQDTSGCPGHAATVFALQCHLFHVPLAPTLVAYLYLEWQSAGHRDGLSGFQDMTPDLPQRLHQWVSAPQGKEPFQPRALD